MPLIGISAYLFNLNNHQRHWFGIFHDVYVEYFETEFGVSDHKAIRVLFEEFTSCKIPEHEMVLQAALHSLFGRSLELRDLNTYIEPIGSHRRHGVISMQPNRKMWILESILDFFNCEADIAETITGDVRWVNVRRRVSGVQEPVAFYGRRAP